MRHEVIFELDDEVKDRLDQWAVENGWTLDETLRYVLGRESHISPTTTIRSLGPVPVTTPKPLNWFSGESFSTTRPALDVNVVNEALLRAIVGTGAIKCRNCFKQLCTEDVIKGECPECEEKI